MKYFYLIFRIIVLFFFFSLDFKSLTSLKLCKVEAVEIVDKISEFLKEDVKNDFHFPKFKEIKRHLKMAIVNKEAIVITDLKKEMDNLLPMKYHKRIAESRRQKLIEKALDNLIIDELYYNEAKAQKINVKEYILEKINEIKAGFKDEKTFNSNLEELNISFEKLTQLFERKVMIQRLISLNVTEKIFITDDEIFIYFSKNKKKFVIPEKRRLRSVSVNVSPDSGYDSWIIARKRMLKIKDMLLEGKDFALIAKKNSDDEYKAVGGDMGIIHKGVLEHSIDKKVFFLKEGEVSDIIGFLNGYKIIKVESIESERERNFDEIDKDMLRAYLLKEKRKKKLFEWTNSLKKNAAIKIIRNQ